MPLPHLSLRPLLLGVSLVALSPAVLSAQDTPILLDEITLEAAPETGTIAAPAQPYPGGQVSTRTRLGALGDLDVQTAPFRATALTEDLIRNQQARSLADVTRNDPSIRQDAPSFSERDSFFIRGFSVTNLDTLYDGLPYIANPRRSTLEGVARVDLFMGPTALVNGGVGRVGGTINMVPKRAEDEDLTRLTTGIAGDSQVWSHLDIGRRFGPLKEWGVRGNLSWRGGDTALDGNNAEVGVATLGLDYRGERLRATLDLNASKQDLDAPTSLFNAVAPGVPVPEAPDGRINTANRFEFHDSEHRMAAGRVEYDIAPATTVYGAFGASRYREDFLSSNYTITAPNGDAVNELGFNPQEIEGRAAEIGLRTEVMTGAISHRISLSAAYALNRNNRGEFNPRLLGFPTLSTNIYDPVFLPGAPDLSSLPTSDRLIPFADLRSRSVALSNTMSLPGDRVQLTFGGRWQEIRTQGFNTRPGNPDAPVGERNFLYEDSAFTPAIAASWQLRDGLNLYANYVEALTEGPIAPLVAENAGELFPAVVNRQREIGMKYDLGTVTLGASLFEIRQPNGITDPATNVFSLSGQQRNRGFELSAAGTPLDGLRLLAGVTLMDAELRRTQNGAFDGNDVPGVPRASASLYAEYDLPRAEGLTLTGRLLQGGATWYDQANTQRVSGWTRVDLGARYAIEAQGREIELRANVENVLDENYWASSARGFLSAGAPRTYAVSASMRF